jgi:hypothetical protein
VSNSDDDDKTVFVSPPTRAPGAPPSNIVLPNDDDDVDDKTVMMKPSQRNREAAAALSVERERYIEGQQAASGADLSSDTVDFDVVSGTPTAPVPPARQRSRTNYAWMAGFFGTLAFAALCAWLIYFFW